MKRNRDTDNWTIDDIDTVAIAEMLRGLRILDDGEKTTGFYPKKRMLTKVKHALKKGKELFCQKFRWYTHKRYIKDTITYLFLAKKVRIEKLKGNKKRMRTEKEVICKEIKK